jgi:hypothetical protein
MSQRTPSHRSAIAERMSTTASRSPGDIGSSWATSGHGGKCGSRPRATGPWGVSSQASGGIGSSPGASWTKNSGFVVTHG